MALVPKIDPNKIFASNAPTQDKPAAFDNYEKGMDETRKNLGRPTIPQLNYLHQTADQKILWIHQNGGGLPYDASIEYAEKSVTLKDGELKQLVDGAWVEVKPKALPATAITTASSQNQQQINDFGGAKWYAKVGGYELGATVKLANGDTVQSTKSANTANPNVDMIGWKKSTVDADALKQYATLALATSDIANIAVNQNIFVSEAANGGYWYKDTAGATSLTKSPYDPLEQAKIFANANPLFKPTTLTTAVDVLTLPEGRHKIEGLVLGKSLINMPDAPFKMGYIDVGITGTSTIYKVVRFTPYGKDTSFYQNSSYEDMTWTGWKKFSSLDDAQAIFATKTEITNGVSASLDNITQSAFFGMQFTAPELAGTKLYTDGTYVGFNSATTAAASFNAIKARVFNADAGNVEYRIYTGAALSSGVNGYGVATGKIANFTYSGVCKSFPKSDTGSAQKIVLDKVITLPATTPFVIVFKNVNLATFGIAAHAAVSGNLDSRSFNLSAVNADWAGLTQIGNASVSKAYVQTGVQLLVDMPSDSTGTVPVYTPTLVMPPKIYVLANLQAHIYPEHLLPEPSDLYLHDVTCLRGKQTTRGWEYDVPTSQAAGNIALNWTLADRQTGATLNTATTTLVVADQTKSGNKNVLVIGDSYVNAGTITQRLLDISATDALKTTLIGTRGAGTNKHEGRGGWKVSDYATVGRTYYQFTVSGITTVPAINSTVYTYGGGTFIVQETAISVGSGTITCSFSSGTAPTNGSTSTLTKRSGAGDATIAFSNVQSLSGNPFWFSGAINFEQYLSTNSLATPDIVLIQLGVNDCFGSTTDTDVESIAATAFAQIDTLITSIKASNAAVKIGIVSPPTYANQDGFGYDYGCGQTTWRAKRNIVTWNKKLYAYFAGKEAQNVYVVAAGLNVDTENNFPTITQAINSQNANTITVQKGGVHPDASGYKQIGDAMFAFMKVVS